MRSSDLLRAIDLFEELTPEDLAQLMRATADRLVRAGEVVSSSEATPYDAMFVVVEGLVEVSRDSADREDGSVPASVTRLGNGDAWGEVELISGERSTWTARAVVDCRLLELARDEFEGFIAERPAAMRRILSAVSHRAAQTNQQLVADVSELRGAVSAIGRVYAVYSTRGGSGKTLLATRLALELERRTPGRVALLDLDLLFDDAALQLSVTPTTSLGELTEAQIQHLDPPMMARLLADQPDGLRVVVGAARPEDGERVTASHVRAVVGALKRQFLATVVDCASTFSEPTLAALEAADRVVVVCTPELVTLRDMRDLQRLLGQAITLDRARVSFVLNHPLPSIGLTRHQFETAFDQKMLIEIEHAGEAASKPSFARAIQHIVDDLSPSAARAHRGLRLTLFGRGARGA